MMVNAKGKIKNFNLLYDRYDEEAEQPAAYSLVCTLTANRPLADMNEARMAAMSLNQIMAFVEFGLAGKDLPAIPKEDVYSGLRAIISACRLMSLRVEHFLDIEGDRIEDQGRQIRRKAGEIE